jgi:hypothetical protein
VVQGGGDAADDGEHQDATDHAGEAMPQHCEDQRWKHQEQQRIGRLTENRTADDDDQQHACEEVPASRRQVDQADALAMRHQGHRAHDHHADHMRRVPGQETVQERRTGVG